MQALMAFLSNHPILTSATLFVLISIIIIEWMRAQRNIVGITPAKAIQLINHENAVVIDIRAKEAFQQGHILNAVCLSGTDIAREPKKLEKYRTKPIIIVAKQPHESQKTAVGLLKNGYHAYSLTGGLSSWTEAQLPLVKG